MQKKYVFLLMILLFLVAAGINILASLDKNTQEDFPMAYSLQNGVDFAPRGKNFLMTQSPTKVGFKAEEKFKFEINNSSDKFRKFVLQKGELKTPLELKSGQRVSLVYPGGNVEWSVECKKDDVADFGAGNAN